MTKQFLDAPEIRTAVKHVRSKGVTYSMECKVFKKVRLDLVLLHNLQQSPVRQSAPADIYKKGAGC